MNWDRIAGNWMRATGKAKERWDRLTDNDLAAVAGRRDHLAGKIRERYGVASDEAERQIADWQRRATELWFLQDRNRI